MLNFFLGVGVTLFTEFIAFCVFVTYVTVFTDPEWESED